MIHHDEDDLAAFRPASRFVVKGINEFCMLFDSRLNEVVLLPTDHEWSVCFLAQTVKRFRRHWQVAEDTSRQRQLTAIDTDR